jgi:hypothetical protein
MLKPSGAYLERTVREDVNQFLRSEDAKMTKPALMNVVRRAYELWEQAGKPEGRDQEFYFEAERQLQEALAKSALKS